MTAVRLAAEICNDGFVTANEPLQVCFNPGLESLAVAVPPHFASPRTSPEDRMVFQSVGYVKGMSRACVMLMLPHLVLKDIHSMQEIFPAFYESARKVHVQVASPTRRGGKWAPQCLLWCSRLWVGEGHGNLLGLQSCACAPRAGVI